MGSGKTTFLMQQIQTRPGCYILAPAIDRSEADLTSGTYKIAAIPLKSFVRELAGQQTKEEIYSYLVGLIKGPAGDIKEKVTIIIDECQFLAKASCEALIQLIRELYSTDLLEACYIAGLDSDVRGELWPATQLLLKELRPSIITPREIQCFRCGKRPATHNMRLLTEQVMDLVMTAKNLYMAVCNSCFQPVDVNEGIDWDKT
jgi:thymidine kinase